MDKQERIVELILKYLSRPLNDEEEKELKGWLSENSNNESFLSKFTNKYITEQLTDENAYETEMQLKRLLEKVGMEKTDKKMKPVWKRIAVAASILVLITIAGYFLIFRNRQREPLVVVKDSNKQINNNIPPGGKKAQLTLANGKNLALESIANGTIVREGGRDIKKLDGELVYNFSENKSIEAVNNTVTTPKGGGYQLTLSDGTKVWLNAGSSIRFPTVFVGNYRNVSITGEVYFEVAKNREMPFVVKTTSSIVQVLGTHFNISNYPDEEAMTTTLLEGSIRISIVTALPNNKKLSRTIKPGQQAIIMKSTSDIEVQEVDADAVASWTKGSFYFDNASLEEVMRQISRWYNVDFVYGKGVPKTKTFKGNIERNISLSEVLSLLQKIDNRIQFTIVSRSIIVTTQ